MNAGWYLGGKLSSTTDFETTFSGVLTTRSAFQYIDGRGVRKFTVECKAFLLVHGWFHHLLQESGDGRGLQLNFGWKYYLLCEGREEDNYNWILVENLLYRWYIATHRTRGNKGIISLILGWILIEQEYSTSYDPVWNNVWIVPLTFYNSTTVWGSVSRFKSSLSTCNVEGGICEASSQTKTISFQCLRKTLKNDEGGNKNLLQTI